MSLNLALYDLADDGGQVLATREKGREIGRRLADRLSEVDGLLIRFDDVTVASTPFLEEALRQLQPVLRGDERHWLLVTGHNEDVRESLEIVLDRAKMYLASLDGDALELLGATSQLLETLEEAQREGTFTAPDLAERLEMKLPAVHQRLNLLVQAGVLARETGANAARGKTGTYKVAPAEELRALASRDAAN
ncbi:MAG: hypothetical protein V7607_4168 [Solirubrobacteraceae bacterium]